MWPSAECLVWTASRPTLPQAGTRVSHVTCILKTPAVTLLCCPQRVAKGACSRQPAGKAGEMLGGGSGDLVAVVQVAMAALLVAVVVVTVHQR